ncbi:MAG TPA: insulinase family protein [Edaphocola sp.]|nr:insulinase family protein [Edaphocola sp.]
MIKPFVQWLAGFMLAAMPTATLPAQQTHEWKEANSGGYSYRYVTNDPAHARFYQLDNGLTVILSPDHKEPRIQTYIAVKAGSKTDPSNHTGLAHYLEHMLFKGTDQFGSLDWTKEKPYLDQLNDLYEQYNSTKDEVQRKAIYHRVDSISGLAAHYAIANEYDKMMSSMGAIGTNAFTSFEQTVYTEDIPSNALDRYLTVQAERFRYPVFRLFHTELEAVYEEKNRTLDNDGRKSFEAMFATLFPNNNYGRQTTIGTIEDLKNPSLVEIRKYFNTYYVPNNMGVIMAGDFNPDSAIAKIDKAFGYMQSKTIPPYTFSPETPITDPVLRNVYGPMPTNIMLGFRFPGASTKDAEMLTLIGSMLTNGSAGLMDLDLVKKQKLLSAYAFPYLLIDYSMLILQGKPMEGQSLDDVKTLMLGELAKLKKGDFSDDLLQGIINNEKKNIIEQNDNYSTRAYMLMDYFTSDLDWQRSVSYISFLNGITKADIVAFANKYLNDNYVAVYKHQGEDKNVVKVDKPAITPVTVNRNDQSSFLKKVNSMPETPVQPAWVDYQKDIQRAQSGPYEFLSVKNKDNSLFRLTYYFDAGSWNDKLLPIAADYLNYIGTQNKSSEEFSKEFYQLASSFNINTSEERTYVTLNGLNENFEKTVQLFEDLWQHCQGDETSLAAYKERLLKARQDAKKNKGRILRGLMSYARYGSDNPFNYELSNEELKNLTVKDLISALRHLAAYPHKILYFGPQPAQQVGQELSQWHPAPAVLAKIPSKHVFTPVIAQENQVFFAPYDMVQAEVMWVRNGDLYNAAQAPALSLFNEYFGGGMGTVVFQTIRESKALAYSTYAYYAQPDDKNQHNYMMAYVGTQADKFNESLNAMNELLNQLPESKDAFENAKTALEKKLATERIIEDQILFSYLKAERLGLDKDIRQTIYNKLPAMSFTDIRQFHQDRIANKPYSYCVVADNAKVTDEEMRKFGTLKKLRLEDIFGY